jgi:hypothetical protein
MARTVGDIQQEHASRMGELLSGYQDTIDEIRAETQPESGEYLDLLEGSQQRGLLREQKEQKATEAHSKVVAEYRASVERYHSELDERRGELQTRLYGVSGSEGAATLSRAALASEDELAMLMDVAATTGNTELAKAAFVAADRRGMGDLVARYFDEVDPDARGLYQEWHEIPPDEVLARQLDNVDRVISPPRNLMPEPATPLYR